MGENKIIIQDYLLREIVTLLCVQGDKSPYAWDCVNLEIKPFHRA